MAGPFQNVHIVDPINPDYVAGVNPDGTLKTAGGGGGGGSTAIDTTVYDEDSPHTSGQPGVLILGIRNDSDTPTANDGDYTAIKIDEVGRVKVAAQPASYALVSGSITANGQTVFCECSRGSNIMAHMVATSLVGHNVTFEGSIDSTNGTDGAWFIIQAVRTNANTIETATGTLAATPTYGWELSVNGLKYVRVRATAHTSGTALWKFQKAPYATEPIPAAQVSSTQAVSGSITNIPSASQGASTLHRLLSAATTNLTSVKTSAGNINSLVVCNDGASKAFFKLYNKTSAPVIGTDTPIKTILIPPGATIIFDCGPFGIRCATGIAYAITGLIADADATAVGAAQLSVNMSYT